MTTNTNPNATVERIYVADIEEHQVTVNGEAVATAHPLFGGRWSVKIGNRFAGIAQTTEAATQHLDRIADQFRATLAA